MMTPAGRDRIYFGTRWYDHTDFERFKRSSGGKQHNIMWLVGNGFDIAVLNELKSPYRTDYKSFFYYLKSTTFNDDNILFQKMNQLRAKDEKASDETGKVPNWSDFESLLQDFITGENRYEVSRDRINADLKEIQHRFSDFLDTVVSPDLLNRLDEKAQESRWAYRTFSRFVADLDQYSFQRFNFSNRTNHYDVFNFNIINFNYTALLDNYLHLDRFQFNPTPNTTVDTNFQFRRNPRDYPVSGPNAETGCSAYLMTEIHHPHGVQQIPRSLLFGIDGNDQAARRGSLSQLEKPFWAQTPRRYQKMIQETELFIVFGSSRGSTDRWWWRHILYAVFNGAELIIYQYSSTGCDANERTKIKSEFINQNFDASLFGRELDGDLYGDISLNVFVVIYSDSASISALGFCDDEFDPLDRSPDNIKPVK